MDVLQLVCREFSNNHEITVCDTAELYGEKGHFRILQFTNEAIQGAMDLADPDRIVFEYPRAIIHLMEFNAPLLENVFVIGHGIGTIARYFSGKRFKIAEQSEVVVKLSRKYFGYREDNVLIGDGRRILENEASRTYDFIVLDAFTEKGTPQHLISREFFRLTREKLDSRGSIVMNLMGKGVNDPLINAIHTTLCEEYAYTRSFCLPSDHASALKNIVIIGRNQPIGFQARHMAGFVITELKQGYLIMDGDSRG
ncbi:MAG: fused MFS/spermidine synthase [Gorillibacterium sp.]|nr:fused MFS/spermidine synthase [Gorillibacterium sp.]